jgi:hypothetical protein
MSRAKLFKFNLLEFYQLPACLLPLARVPRFPRCPDPIDSNRPDPDPSRRSGRLSVHVSFVRIEHLLHPKIFRWSLVCRSKNGCEGSVRM